MECVRIKSVEMGMIGQVLEEHDVSGLVAVGVGSEGVAGVKNTWIFMCGIPGGGATE